jgi:hypothetical protein
MGCDRDDKGPELREKKVDLKRGIAAAFRKISERSGRIYGGVAKTPPDNAWAPEVLGL